MQHIEKNLNGRQKYNYINNNVQCEKIKQSNQRWRFLGWIKEQDPTIYCLQEKYVKLKNYN